MAKAVLIIIAFLTALTVATGDSGRSHFANLQQQTSAKISGPPEGAIKVTIATLDSPLGSPTDHYKVGDQIPVTITMTNTSTQPLKACISSDLYQNLPQLTRNGQVLPYTKWQVYDRTNAQRNQTCQTLNLPQPVLLYPKEATLADWFVLVDDESLTGMNAWYDTLSPGKYELLLQRRLSCCDGSMIQSNKISFEVAP